MSAAMSALASAAATTHPTRGDSTAAAPSPSHRQQQSSPSAYTTASGETERSNNNQQVLSMVQQQHQQHYPHLYQQQQLKQAHDQLVAQQMLLQQQQHSIFHQNPLFAHQQLVQRSEPIYSSGMPTKSLYQHINQVQHPLQGAMQPLHPLALQQYQSPYQQQQQFMQHHMQQQPQQSPLSHASASSPSHHSQQQQSQSPQSFAGQQQYSMTHSHDVKPQPFAGMTALQQLQMQQQQQHHASHNRTPSPHHSHQPVATAIPVQPKSASSDDAQRGSISDLLTAALGTSTPSVNIAASKPTPQQQRPKKTAQQSSTPKPPTQARVTSVHTTPQPRSAHVTHPPRSTPPAPTSHHPPPAFKGLQSLYGSSMVQKLQQQAVSPVPSPSPPTISPQLPSPTPVQPSEPQAATPTPTPLDTKQQLDSTAVNAADVKDAKPTTGRKRLTTKSPKARKDAASATASSSTAALSTAAADSVVDAKSSPAETKKPSPVKRKKSVSKGWAYVTESDDSETDAATDAQTTDTNPPLPGKRARAKKIEQQSSSNEVAADSATIPIPADALVVIDLHHRGDSIELEITSATESRRLEEEKLNEQYIAEHWKDWWQADVGPRTRRDRSSKGGDDADADSAQVKRSKSDRRRASNPVLAAADAQLLAAKQLEIALAKSASTTSPSIKQETSDPASNSTAAPATVKQEAEAITQPTSLTNVKSESAIVKAEPSAPSESEADADTDMQSLSSGVATDDDNAPRKKKPKRSELTKLTNDSFARQHLFNQKPWALKKKELLGISNERSSSDASDKDSSNRRRRSDIVHGSAHGLEAPAESSSDSDAETDAESKREAKRAPTNGKPSTDVKAPASKTVNAAESKALGSAADTKAKRSDKLSTATADKTRDKAVNGVKPPSSSAKASTDDAKAAKKLISKDDTSASSKPRQSTSDKASKPQFTSNRVFNKTAATDKPATARRQTTGDIPAAKQRASPAEKPKKAAIESSDSSSDNDSDNEVLVKPAAPVKRRSTSGIDSEPTKRAKATDAGRRVSAPPTSGTSLATITSELARQRSNDADKQSATKAATKRGRPPTHPQTNGKVPARRTSKPAESKFKSDTESSSDAEMAVDSSDDDESVQTETSKGSRKQSKSLPTPPVDTDGTAEDRLQYLYPAGHYTVPAFLGPQAHADKDIAHLKLAECFDVIRTWNEILAASNCKVRRVKPIDASECDRPDAQERIANAVWKLQDLQANPEQAAKLPKVLQPVHLLWVHDALAKQKEEEEGEEEESDDEEEEVAGENAGAVETAKQSSATESAKPSSPATQAASSDTKPRATTLEVAVDKSPHALVSPTPTGRATRQSTSPTTNPVTRSPSTRSSASKSQQQ